MEYLIALALSILIGLGVGAVIRVRFRNSSFSIIHRQVTVVVAVLLFSFALFAFIGPNIWSTVFIPLVTLVIVFFLVRNAVHSLLELR
jgi:hypothetical protein